jgi:hypothetical protein
VKAFGGSDETQSAVAKALGWLARHQDKKTGLWSLQGPYLDGGSQENQLAATAMALLAFQGAGHTTTEGKFRDVVKRGWKALLARQLPEGRFDIEPMPSQHGLYSHAQATIAALTAPQAAVWIAKCRSMGASRARTRTHASVAVPPRRQSAAQTSRRCRCPRSSARSVSAHMRVLLPRGGC